jgi:hypothetical protein
MNIGIGIIVFPIDLALVEERILLRINHMRTYWILYIDGSNLENKILIEKYI